MGKSLAEYAAQHPQEMREEDRRALAEGLDRYLEQQQALEQVDQLKASIMQQLQKGNAPQYVLYTAIKTIGILTYDTEWSAAGQKILDSVYADLAQQSLLTDNTAIAAQRLDTMQTQYNDKLRRQLKTQLNGYRRIEKALIEALQAVAELDPQNTAM